MRAHQCTPVHALEIEGGDLSSFIHPLHSVKVHRAPIMCQACSRPCEPHRWSKATAIPALLELIFRCRLQVDKNCGLFRDKWTRRSRRTEIILLLGRPRRWLLGLGLRDEEEPTRQTWGQSLRAESTGWSRELQSRRKFVPKQRLYPSSKTTRETQHG